MGNLTYNDLKQDAKKAVKVLMQQPEVNSTKISLIGHSEGGEIVTILAADNLTTKFDNIILMAPRIENPRDQIYYGFVGFPLEYAKIVLDKNHNGSFSLQEALQDQIFQSMVGGNTSLILSPTITDNNSTELSQLVFNISKDRYVNILTKFKPVLEKRMEKSFEGTKCENPMAGPCPIYLGSIVNLSSTLSILDNVSSSTDILILHGQNDSGSRVQLAFLLEQKLSELITLITF